MNCPHCGKRLHCIGWVKGPDIDGVGDITATEGYYCDCGAEFSVEVTGTAEWDDNSEDDLVEV